MNFSPVVAKKYQFKIF